MAIIMQATAWIWVYHIDNNYTSAPLFTVEISIVRTKISSKEHNWCIIQGARLKISCALSCHNINWRLTLYPLEYLLTQKLDRYYYFLGLRFNGFKYQRTLCFDIIVSDTFTTLLAYSGLFENFYYSYVGTEVLWLDLNSHPPKDGKLQMNTLRTFKILLKL